MTRAPTGHYFSVHSNARPADLDAQPQEAGIPDNKITCNAHYAERPQRRSRDGRGGTVGLQTMSHGTPLASLL